MNKKKFTLLIDAQHLQINLLNWYALASKAKNPNDEYRVRDDKAFSASFWMTVGYFLKEFLNDKDADCYESDGRLSFYLFDAHYEQSDIAEIDSTGVRFLRPEDKDHYKERKQLSDRIYSMTLAFPGDKLYKSTAPEADYPDYLDIQIHCVSSPRPFTFRDIPTTPGIYKGFLARDNRENDRIGQKAVDTMITLCGVIKANEGRNIALLSSDADFLPLANYVLSNNLQFSLVHAGMISKKWDIFSQDERFDIHQLPEVTLFSRDE